VVKDSREHPAEGAEGSDCRVLRSVVESWEWSFVSSDWRIGEERLAGVECAEPPPAEESSAMSLHIVVVGWWWWWWWMEVE
jgi:hypothetical protein